MLREVRHEASFIENIYNEELAEKKPCLWIYCRYTKDWAVLGLDYTLNMLAININLCTVVITNVLEVTCEYLPCVNLGIPSKATGDGRVASQECSSGIARMINLYYCVAVGK